MKSGVLRPFQVISLFLIKMRVGFWPDFQKKTKQNCTFFSGHFPATGTSKPTKIISITCLLMEGTVKAMGTLVLFYL